MKDFKRGSFVLCIYIYIYVHIYISTYMYICFFFWGGDGFGMFSVLSRILLELQGFEGFKGLRVYLY